jgi:hypothetical protein
MSEAELHLLAGRLQGARRAAAERGELRLPLPVGYVYDDDGAIVVDPDEEIRAAIADVFACFEETGSAYKVVGAFTDRQFPARAYGGAWAGQVRHGRLTHSRAQTVLRNPAYAGAYVFARAPPARAARCCRASSAAAAADARWRPATAAASPSMTAPTAASTGSARPAVAASWAT